VLKGLNSLLQQVRDQPLTDKIQLEGRAQQLISHFAKVQNLRRDSGVVLQIISSLASFAPMDYLQSAYRRNIAKLL